MTTKIKIEIKPGEVLAESAFKVDPGTGAIKLAQEFAVGRTRDEVEEILSDLIDGNFEGANDKRVKRCQYCGYFYRDITRANSSHTCSPECKSGKDNLLKRYRRRIREDAGLKPKRKLLKDEHYADGEYPFFASDYWMFEYDRRNQTYSYGDNFESYIGWYQNRTHRKKVAPKSSYSGKHEEKPVRNIKFSVGVHKQASNGAITVSKESRENISKHLESSYGAQKLAFERKHALLFEKR